VARSRIGKGLRSIRTQLRGLGWRVRKGSLVEPRVNYGEMPQGAGGVLRKAERLQRRFPQTERGFNLLYAIGGCLPPYDYCRSAKLAGIPIVFNANGLYYQGGHGDGWEAINERIARVYHLADYVFFQSEFSKFCYEELIGEPNCQWEFLYNAVDTQAFSPPNKTKKQRPLTLLTAGLHRHLYRLLPVVEALCKITRRVPDARLIIAGAFAKPEDQLVVQRMAERLGVSEAVTFSGPYDLNSAAEVFGKADILVHAVYNDPCPSVVLEAMACGLPVVCASTGGTPELVRDGDAGVAVPSEMSFDKPFMLEAEAIADAVMRIVDDLEGFSRRARTRAVNHFDIRHWYSRHEEVFKLLLISPSRRRKSR